MRPYYATFFGNAGSDGFTGGEVRKIAGGINTLGRVEIMKSSGSTQVNGYDFSHFVANGSYRATDATLADHPIEGIVRINRKQKGERFRDTTFVVIPYPKMFARWDAAASAHKGAILFPFKNRYAKGFDAGDRWVFRCEDAVYQFLEPMAASPLKPKTTMATTWAALKGR